jgi:soluble lytic murein transglycosylase
VDYRLVLAVMKVESNYRQYVVSPDGSRGFMQIHPSLARSLAKEAGIPYGGSKDLYDARKNIRLGTHYLSKVIGLFNDIPTALFAYSVGHHKAKRLLAREINPHTPYTKRVIAEYQKNTKKMVVL